jgi:hypothetical protein
MVRMEEEEREGAHVEDTGHGRNVQTEKSTTDTCERTYDVLHNNIALASSSTNIRRKKLTGFEAILALY